MDLSLSSTTLDYFYDMSKLHSTSTLISYSQGGDDDTDRDRRGCLVLSSTIFHPQGGGQPCDTGYVSVFGSDIKFVVQDVRSKDGIVFHYGFIENFDGKFDFELFKGKEVLLYVDKLRRQLNSRLHSAGHLLDACLQNVGLGHLDPVKGYHFPDGPYVEYKGTVPQNELESKRKELELESNALISIGGKVTADVLSYEEASKLCGGSLPDYIAKSSTPRIVKLGDIGCPCGGTHVSDVSEIISLKVTQVRTKKGMAKVFYALGS